MNEDWEEWQASPCCSALWTTYALSDETPQTGSQFYINMHIHTYIDVQMHLLAYWTQRHIRTCLYAHVQSHKKACKLSWWISRACFQFSSVQFKEALLARRFRESTICRNIWTVHNNSNMNINTTLRLIFLSLRLCVSFTDHIRYVQLCLCRVIADIIRVWDAVTITRWGQL